MRILFVAVTAVILAACGPVLSDPCAGRANSAECRLYSAQVEATLDASEVLRIAQATRAANDRIIAATQQAAEIERAQALAYAAATATVEAAQAQAAIERANAEATIAAATIEAQRSAAEATSTAVANAIALENQRLAAEATATAVSDASRLRHEQAQNEINLARFGGFVEGALKLVIGLVVILAAAYAFIRIVNTAWRGFDEWRRVYAKRVDVGDGRIVIYDQANGKIHDPRLAVAPVTDLSTDGIPPGLTREMVDLLIAVKKIVDTAEVYRAMARARVDVDEGDGALVEVGRQPDAPLPSELPTGEAERLPSAPAFPQLLKEGYRARVDKMLLAFDENGPVYGRLDHLLSVAIAGRQGMGKTMFLRWVYANAIMIGAQIELWDVHDDVLDELPGVIAYTRPDQIRASALRVQTEMDRRIRNHLRDETPILIMSDEANAVLGMVPETVEVVKRLVFEGRKYQMYCMLSTKSMPAKMFGDQGVRDAFSAHVAYQCSRAIARQIGFDSDVLDEFAVNRLPVGYALFDAVGAPRIVQVPRTETEDIKALLPPSRAPSATSGRGNGSGNGSGAEVAQEVAGEVDPEVAARRERVRRLLAQKTPISRIVKKEWGATGGSAYQRAATELSDIIAGLVPAD